jgi:hypothetical protein
VREYTLSGEGCRDSQGKFVPVSQCTGKRPKPKGQKPLGGTSGMKMKIGDVMCVNGRKLKRTRKGVRFIKGKCTGRKRILKRVRGR